MDYAELPDYIGALILYLREAPGVTALCPPERITGELLNMPAKTWGLWVGKIGGDGSHPYLPSYSALLEMRCYAATKYEAMRLFRRTKPVLEPLGRSGGSTFTRAGCTVLDLTMTSSPMEMVDPIDDSPFVLTRWRAVVSEVAA